MQLENGANLPTTDPLASQLLQVATTLAQQAGDMALAGRRNGLENVQTKSTATDMVTEFDKASEVLIAGAAGAAIGYSIVDLQCEGECSVGTGIGLLLGAITGAIGMSIVSVLVLRAVGEWRELADN